MTTSKGDLVTIDGEGDKAWRVDKVETVNEIEQAHLTDPDNKYVHTAAETSRLAKASKKSPAAAVAHASENNVRL